MGCGDSHGPGEILHLLGRFTKGRVLNQVTELFYGTQVSWNVTSHIEPVAGGDAAR